MRCRVLAVIAVLLAAAANGHSTGTAGQALAASLATNCAAVTVTVHPGLNPPGTRPAPYVGGAPDAPKGPFTVSLPVYPGATPLQPFVGSPFPEYQASPYLQTAGLEYVTSGPAPQAGVWVDRAFHACGWVARGIWDGNTTPFDNGDTYQARNNHNLSVEVSYGAAPSGATYIAYGVEEIIYPPRPAKSYLHGPFVDLKMAVLHGAYLSGRLQKTTTHLDVRDRAAIGRLVSAINRIKLYQSVTGFCVGGGGGGNFTGPAWLSFIRPDGTTVHAYADGPGGACFGGFAVNGARWLIGAVDAWNQVLALAGGGRG
jgi:hypothetical protein